MNKARILGIILILVGFILMFKIENSENGWFVNALVGSTMGAGSILAIFGTFNFKS